MGRKKTNKNYFTQDTEDAIIEYLASTNQTERNKIFNDRIYYALYKLSENLIHTFKFYYTEVEDLEDLKHEVIIFLLEKLHYFDPSKGFKAYSYFSIVGKNYLILYNNKNYNKKKQMGDLIEADSDTRVLNNIEHDLQREDKKDFLYYFIEYMEGNLERLYTDL
jgi:DNA-directed RNA polymerase specialized sigma24 family protein